MRTKIIETLLFLLIGILFYFGGEVYNESLAGQIVLGVVAVTFYISSNSLFYGDK